VSESCKARFHFNDNVHFLPFGFGREPDFEHTRFFSEKDVLLCVIFDRDSISVFVFDIVINENLELFVA